MVLSGKSGVLGKKWLCSMEKSSIHNTLSIDFLGGGKALLLWYTAMYFLFCHDTCFNKINNFNLKITQKLKFKKANKFIAHKGHS